MDLDNLFASVVSCALDNYTTSYQTVAERLVEHFELAAAGIYVIDPASHRLILRASAGEAASVLRHVTDNDGGAGAPHHSEEPRVFDRTDAALTFIKTDVLQASTMPVVLCPIVHAHDDEVSGTTMAKPFTQRSVFVLFPRDQGQARLLVSYAPICLSG